MKYFVINFIYMGERKKGFIYYIYISCRYDHCCSKLEKHVICSIIYFSVGKKLSKLNLLASTLGESHKTVSRNVGSFLDVCERFTNHLSFCWSSLT